MAEADLSYDFAEIPGFVAELEADADMEFASEMVIRAAKEKLEVRQFPIEYHPRGGESKLSSFRDGLAPSPLPARALPQPPVHTPGRVDGATRGADPVGDDRAPAVFGRLWDIHTLIAGALLSIVGTQVVALGICARAYGTYFMGKRDRWLDRMHARFNPEHGLALGRMLTFVRVAVACVIVADWARRGFGDVGEDNLAVVAATLIIVGIQIFRLPCWSRSWACGAGIALAGGTSPASRTGRRIALGSYTAVFPMLARTIAQPEPGVESGHNGRTLVFIPAFNEERTVGSVVHGILKELPGVDVLVVGGGSTDTTAVAARAAGARVASLPFNQGLGAALHTGYLVARRDGYDYCAHLDADGQHPVRELKRILIEVWQNHCDLALGSRYHPDQERLPAAYRPTFARRAGIWLFRSLFALTSGCRFTDTTSGLRAANRRAIALFAHRYQPDFGELESLQRSVREGLKIAEVPVVMLPRVAGRSKITAHHFVFKGLLVVFVGALRRSEHKEKAC